MIDWFAVAGVIWLLLVAVTIFLALCRISTAVNDQKLMRAGPAAAGPLHAHLRRLIQSEDRIGIVLTIAAVACSVVLAFLFADRLLRDTVHKLVQILSFE